MVSFRFDFTSAGEIPFAGNQLPMPLEQRFRLDDGADLYVDGLAISSSNLNWKLDVVFQPGDPDARDFYSSAAKVLVRRGSNSWPTMDGSQLRVK
jgi:hypothetical protein